MTGIGAAISGLSLAWQLGLALMGRTVVIAKRSQTCDIKFHEFNRAPNRFWRVGIHIWPAKGVIIKNAEGKQYRFEAQITRRNYGSQEIYGEWNKGPKDKRHSDSIDIDYEGLPPSWITSNNSDWEIDVWIVIGSKRMKTLYKGPPTGVIELTKDK